MLLHGPTAGFSQQGPSVQIATRTLIVAGFKVLGFIRHPRHGEYECTHLDVFGTTIPYTIALFDDDPTAKQISNIKRIAQRRGHVFVAVARSASTQSIGWEEFLELLGGAVPSWRALGPTFEDILRKSAKNIAPDNSAREAWQLFEDATADGFEFLFGQRVIRLGGRKRGRNLSDMITRTPDGSILVIDAKASKTKYSVGSPQLRPLLEYVNEQKIRQKGSSGLSAAVIVANEFKQSHDRLSALNGDFLSSSRVSLAFLRVDDFLRMISQMRKHPTMRTSIRWSRIFGCGGIVKYSIFSHELTSTIESKYRD